MFFLKKFKSTVKPRRISDVSQPASEGQQDREPSQEESRDILTDWPYLKLFRQTMQRHHSPSWFSSIQGTVDKFVEHVEAFNTEAKECQEYEILQDKFELLFKELQQFASQDRPETFLTDAVAGLCRMIEQELSNILMQEGQDYDQGPSHAGIQDTRNALACYHRIQSHLQRIALNVLEWKEERRTKSGRLSFRKVNDMALALGNSPDIVMRSSQFWWTNLPDVDILDLHASNTLTHVLSRILTWLDSSIPSSVFWISGMLGTGKTMLASALCRELRGGKLVACFFCSRSDPWQRQVNLIIPSIAFQLAEFSDSFCNSLSGVLQGSAWLSNQSSPDLLFDSLITQPLLEVKDTLPNHLIVIIDALDECEEKASTSRLLEVMLSRGPDFPIKFVVLSRPEPQIRDPIGGQIGQKAARVLHHELDRDIIQKDVGVYIHSSLSDYLATCPTYKGLMRCPHEQAFPHYLTVSEVAPLVQQAGPLFIYALEIVNHITKIVPRGDPDICTQLRSILAFESPSECKVKYCQKLDERYTHVLREALDDPHLSEAVRVDMRRVLYAVVRDQKSWDVTSISRLLKINTNRVWAALRPFYSVLHVSKGSSTGVVTTLHPSFAVYMMDPSRSGTYCCDPQFYSHPLTLWCFQLFRNMRPQFNICGVTSSYIPDSDILGLKERVKNTISANLLYAARYWAIHLHSTIISESLDLLHELEEFLSARLLLWMEIMSLKGRAHALPVLMQMVKDWVERHPGCSAYLKSLTHDAWRFTNVFAFSAASNSTPHIYVSMLPFWPKSSPIFKCYEHRGMIKVTGTAVDRRQHGILAIWHFSDTTRSPVYSTDGSQIAVAVGSNILLLNASTGQRIFSSFKGHMDLVLSVRFSPDGAWIVSGSSDKSIRVWNTKGGKAILTIRGHIGAVNSVEFSPDGIHVVSGSQDETICVFDVRDGRCILGPLIGYGSIAQVRYSPDGSRIISCTRGGVVMRSANDGHVLRIFLPNSSDVRFRSVDISPDGTRIASGSIENAIYVWDVESGKLIESPLTINSSTDDHGPFISTLFSPDGSLLLSSHGRNLCLWNTSTRRLAHGPLGGHTNDITSFSFSPNGAHIISGSCDKTLCLWDVQNIPAEPDFWGHASSVTSVGFSLHDTHVVSGSADGNVCVWYPKSGGALFTPVKRGPCGKVQIQAMYSPDGTCILTNISKGLVLLDSQTGDTILGPIQLQKIQSAVFSSDGTCIVLGSATNTVRVLSATTGKSLTEFCPPITKQSNWVRITSIASSPDSSSIAVGSMHYCYSIHDAFTGKLLGGPFDGYTNGSSSLAFSPDGNRIVSGSFCTVQVRNAQSGEIVVGPLEGHTDWVNSVKYSPDGNCIISGGRDNTIYVWDAQTGQLILGSIKGHTAPVRSISCSYDGARVASGSDDGTIRITNIKKEFEYPPGSLPPTGSEWELNTDGWVVDNKGRLLVWVPPELRSSLMGPRTELIISRKGWLRLNFSDAHLGESWVNYHRVHST